MCEPVEGEGAAGAEGDEGNAEVASAAGSVGRSSPIPCWLTRTEAGRFIATHDDPETYVEALEAYQDEDPRFTLALPSSIGRTGLAEGFARVSYSDGHPVVTGRGEGQAREPHASSESGPLSEPIKERERERQRLSMREQEP